MAKIGLHQFSVRYQYQVNTGKKDEKKQAILRNKTATRTVECESPSPSDKDLAEILEQSHRKESPIGLKVLAFEPVSGSKVQAQATDERLKLEVADLTVRAGNLEAQVAALEANVNILANSIDQLAERLPGPDNKSAKADDKSKAKS